MPHCNRYEIEIRGRATSRVLHPVVDDFRIEPTDHGTTRLVGEIRDPSHLHGLIAHFTSMNVDVVSLRCVARHDDSSAEPADHDPATHQPGDHDAGRTQKGTP